MKKITADRIYPVASEPLERTVLITDNAGKILALEPLERHDPASVEQLRGALIPGFVNTHCHLELSHMRGRVDTGTGLIPFITAVVTLRDSDPERIAEAIQNAENEMLANGIVAVGDISNTTDTFDAKARGRLRYHTFVELFDFLQDDRAGQTFEKGKQVFDALQLAPGSAKTLVPHAPYSVSRSLFEKINAHNGTSENATVSIHNQETPPENDLFLLKKGGFLPFYRQFGISLRKFKPTGRTSIHYAMENLNSNNRTLFVHNTRTVTSEILAAMEWNPNAYWATCPNANIYIEKSLPKWYQSTPLLNERATIGTDSLASNWQLSILEEMKIIAVPFRNLLRWATLNGAQALGFDDTLGSFEVGKTPGVLLLEGLSDDEKLSEKATVRRLA